MKKAFVTCTFIFSFTVYSLYQYLGASGSVVYVAPTPSTTHTSVPTQTTSQPVIANKNTIVSKTQTQTTTHVVRTPSTPTPTPVKKNGLYADGIYTGSVADAYYGNIQVQATIQNGRITHIQFLQYPNDRNTSVRINSQADPILAQEAISAQSANVDIVSGATDSSRAFQQSLGSALTRAKNS